MRLDERPPFREDITSPTLIGWLHIGAFLLHLISGVLGYYACQSHNPEFRLTVPLFEFVKGASDINSFIKPLPTTAAHVRAFTPSLFVEFFTAGAHLIYWFAMTFDGFDYYIRKVLPSPSANPLRWVEYAITASVMSSFGGVNMGMNDFFYLMKTFALGVILQTCGYLIELLDSTSDDRRDKIFFNVLYWIVGYISNFVSVGLMLGQLFASKLHSELHLFIENSLPFAFYFSLFGIVCRYSYQKRGLWIDPWFAEKYYIVLSWSTKIAVFWLSFGTYRKIIADLGFGSSGINWDAVRYCAIAIPFVPLAIIFVYDMIRWKSVEKMMKKQSARRELTMTERAQNERRATETRYKKFNI